MSPSTLSNQAKVFQGGPNYSLHTGPADVPLVFLAFLLNPIHRILCSPGPIILEHIQKGFIQLGIGNYIPHLGYHQASTEEMTTALSYKKMEEMERLSLSPVAKEQ